MYKTNKKTLFCSAIYRMVVAVLCLSVFLGLFFVATEAHADVCPAGGDHTYHVFVDRYATEEEDGVRAFVCTKCGHRYEQVIPATGHLWGPWIVSVEPTCSSPGYEYRVCERYEGHSHLEERLVPALSATGDHIYVLAEEVLSTCEAAGYSVYVCANCGEGYREELSALGHEWSEWRVVKEPTVTEEGVRERVCLHDVAHVEREAISLLEPEEEALPATVVPLSEDAGTNTFFGPPNAFDAAALGVDLTLLVVFLVLSFPLIRQMTWVKKKRAEAKRAYIMQAREGVE